ncbi:MAG TPA: antibiotic biosynthesis monooxygenase family protein [Candidatus Limnocylindrales bacterium]|nr:antibiotic biosynthesis monooxygenase family protein [Candidatus Limnocylindrales bacterium]
MSVLEVVRIVARDGRGDAFGPRLANGLASQASSEGCLAVSTRRSVERPDEYLLLLDWESVEAHTAWQQTGRQAWQEGVGWEIVDGGAMGLKHYRHVATIKGPQPV